MSETDWVKFIINTVLEGFFFFFFFLLLLRLFPFFSSSSFLLFLLVFPSSVLCWTVTGTRRQVGVSLFLLLYSSSSVVTSHVSNPCAELFPLFFRSLLLFFVNSSDRSKLTFPMAVVHRRLALEDLLSFVALRRMKMTISNSHSLFLSLLLLFFFLYIFSFFF